MPVLEVHDHRCSADVPEAPNDHEDLDDGDGDGERVRWVTVATFDDPSRAHLARLKLESENIPCVLNDEHITATAWHYALATGGVKLKVPEPDAPRAEAMLAERAPASLRMPDDGTAVTTDLECPHCGSLDHRPARFTSRRVVGLIVIGFLLAGVAWIIALMATGWCLWSILMAADRRCIQCGHTWSVQRGAMRRGFDVLSAPSEPS